MNAETVNQATSTGRAKAESEQLDDLTKIYLRLITSAGRRAAAAFRQQTALVAATNPKWVPPGNNLVDADQLTADAKRKTAGPHEQILRTVTAADEIGIEWTLNHPTSQQLLASVASRLDTLNAALRLQVSETIQEGYDQGWSVDQTAKAIVAKVDDVAPARAAMYARTDLIALSNGGSLMAAQIAGVGAKSWLTAGDERVRETHADADGQTVPIDQPFDVGGEQAMYPGDPDLSDEEALNCRCVAPGVSVSDAVVTGAMMRPFEGDLWRITTARGRSLSVTGEHPVLTRNGWKPAKLLDQGDHLVCAPRANPAAGSPDEHDVPSRADELFAAVALTAARSERVMQARVNLHGDVPDREVDIAIADDLLPLRGDSTLGEEFVELALTLAHREMSLDRNSSSSLGAAEPDLVGSTGVSRFAASVSENAKDRASLNAVLSVKREDAHPFIEIGDDWRDERGTVLHAEQSSRLGMSSAASCLSDPVVDRHDREAELIGDLLIRLAGRVELDEVAAVDVERFSGHVYNFSTVWGTYLAEGIVTANCTLIYADSLAASASEPSPEGARMEPMTETLTALRELVPDLDTLTDAEVMGMHALILAATKKHGYRGDGGMCAICGEPATADCHYQAASDDAVNAAVTIIVSDDDDPDAVVDAPLSLNWEGVLTLEGIATSDGRYFMPGAWGNRDLPLTLLAQLATEEGHDGAQVCGTIENIWKVDRPDLGDGVVAVMGSGTFDPGDFGRDVARLVAAQTLRGVSVDYTVEERGIYDPATSSLIDETPDDSSELFIGNLQLAAVKATIGAATLCAVPAFAAASISVTPTAVLACGYEFSLVPALVASVAPLSPPAAWFEDPKLDRPTPLQITDDGRVFGHLALWSSCHQGNPGRCVPPPRSRSGYSLFHVGAIKTEEGETLAIGKITLKAPHADVALNSEAARAHYDNTGTVAAFVRAGEDQFGPWVAGALRSDAPEEIVRDLLANPLSGDWRAGEMIAAHAVPAPGFPVLRASAFDEEGNEVETALIVTSSIPLTPLEAYKPAAKALLAAQRERDTEEERLAIEAQKMAPLAYLRPGNRKVA